MFLAIAVDNLSDPESAEEEDIDAVTKSVPETEDSKKAVEGVVTEGDTKVNIYNDYPEEYDEYHADGVYNEDGYQLPSEEEYYQREYTYKQERSASISSSSKSKPMPKEYSLFLFSPTNRYIANNALWAMGYGQAHGEKEEWSTLHENCRSFIFFAVPGLKLSITINF